MHFVENGRRYGIEMKHQDAPRLTPSMRIALKDLRLDHLTVLYPGSRAYELGQRVSVVPLARLAEGDGRAILPSVRRARGGGRAAAGARQG